MQLKQTKISLVRILTVLIAAAGIILFSHGNTALAYTCADPANPTDVYEYHESDGECWKVRYTERTGSGAPTAPTPIYNNNTLTCPGGASPSAGPKGNQCAVSCPSGDAYHSDTNSCWYKNGYTQEDTNKVVPTHNDGTPLTQDEAACSDGFDYIKNGGQGPGCYKKFGNNYPCGPDQNVVTSRAGQSCEDSGKKHLVPKDKNQSADKTTANKPQTTQTCPNGGSVDATTGLCPDGSKPVSSDTISDPAGKENLGTCGTHGSDNKDVETVLIGCDQQSCGVQAPAGTSSGQSKSFSGVPVITCILKYGISALTVLVGVGAVAGIAWEAVQYARAQDDQSIVSNARKRIRDIVIGLVAYVFMIAILGWLIPGGILP